MIDQQKKNRLFIVCIFALSIIPMVMAWTLSQNLELLSKGTNNGQLVIPPITTEPIDYQGFDEFSESNKKELPAHWLIVNVITGVNCEAVCFEAILKTKQIRLMLNKELSRTRRVVMLLDSVPTATAQQFWLKDSVLWRLRASKSAENEALYSQLLQQSAVLDDALITRLIGQENREFALNSDLIRIKPSAAMIAKLKQASNGQLTDGMLFLFDPLGNIMMRYEPGFDPYKVKNDLMHLLKISQIG